MNGETRLKLKGGLIGGIIGAAIMLLLTFCSVSYGYGSLNNRVGNLEKKTEGIAEISERLVIVETIVKSINDKL